jgi:glycine/D-amino acid oxidase-like deaminating enzyme
MPQRAVAVIGAGIAGCLAARELAAREPDASITVIERDAVGAGASRRSAGLHLLRGSTPRVRRMAGYSHAYYADLKLAEPDLPIYPLGVTVVTDGGPIDSGGPGDDGANGQGSDGHGSDGGLAVANGRGLPDDYLPEARPVPAGPVGGRPRGSLPGPAVSLPAGCRGWHISGSHYTDVYRLTQALAAQLRPRVRFVEGVEVTGVTLAGHGTPVTVHGGTGEQFAADAVVLAPGPWLAAPAWRDLVAPLRLRVKKIVALHIERRPGLAERAVVFDDEDAFLLPVGYRGHWLFSYSCQEWDVEPGRLSSGPGLSAGDISAARDCLRRYSPALAGACRGGRVFCDAYSPDGEPVVRALDEAGRIVFAGAANGSGYRLAPAIAAQAADLVLRGGTGQPPESARQPGAAPGGPPQDGVPTRQDGPARHDLPTQRGEGVRSDHQYV